MTDTIVDNPIDFHTTNTMLDQHPDVRNPLVVGFFIISQCTLAWLLLGLEDRHSRQREALKATLLPKDTSFWQTVLGCIGLQLYDGGSRRGRGDGKD